MTSAADRLRALADKATPGPWEPGDVWSLCGVMPEKFGEGKCVHCHNIGTEPVWVGRADINGTIMLAHRHRVASPYGTDHLISGANGDLVCGNFDYEQGGVVSERDISLIALAPVAVREWAACLDALAQIRDWNRAGIGNEADAVEAMDSALARAEQHTKEDV